MEAAQKVNLSARRAYAELLRQFHAGRMTNFEYERRFDSIVSEYGTDDAIDSIYLFNWGTYCDMHRHRMTDRGRRLTQECRGFIAQSVLLLRTEFAIGPELSKCRAEFRSGLWRFAGVGVVIVAVFLISPYWFSVAVAFTVLVTILAAIANSALRSIFSRPQRIESETIPSYWPFANADDLSAARRRIVYLGGTNQQLHQSMGRA